MRCSYRASDVSADPNTVRIAPPPKPQRPALRLFFWRVTQPASGSLLHLPPACADGAPHRPPVSFLHTFRSPALPQHPLQGATTMLKYAVIFALISLVAGALGFSGVAAGAAGIAKVLFVLFLVIAVVFVVLAAIGVGAARKVLK